MKSISEIVRSWLLFIIYMAGFALYGLGVYHSVKKHSTGDIIASIFLPPWTIYRGAEYFWHKDVDSVNWNEELDLATKEFAYLCITSLSSKGGTELIQQTFEFKTKFEGFPENIRKELKNQSKDYIRYIQSYSIDILNYCNRVLSNEKNIEPFVFSNITMQIEKKLKDYGLEREMKLQKQEIQSVMAKVTEVSNRKEILDDKIVFNSIKDMAKLMNRQELEITSFYKEVFNEDFIE